MPGFGGGIIGSSIAHHLASQGLGGHVAVLEPDPTCARSSTTRSAAALRTQCNLGINVAMSRYGHAFFSQANACLSLGDLLLSAQDFERVKWLKTDGLGAATLGRAGEGWLEPLPALQTLRRKAESHGRNGIGVAADRGAKKIGIRVPKHQSPLPVLPISSTLRLPIAASVHAPITETTWRLHRRLP